MTLKQLEAFYWAATLGNFASAAERLFITQSSLSKRISDLEEDLNCELFDRSGQKSVLTDAGHTLLKSARTMLDLSENIRADVHQAALHSPLSGVCRFGISELSATTWFPAFVERMRHTFPRLALEPRVILTRKLEHQVERGEIDFAVVAGPVTSDALAYQLVSQIPLALVTSPQHAGHQATLSAEALQEQDFLTHSPESGLALVFSNWLATHNLKARRTIVCNSLTVITTLAVAGLGTSLLPLHYIQPLIEQGRLAPLRSKVKLPLLDYHLIWHRDDIRPMTRAVKELVLPAIDFSIPNPLWIFPGKHGPSY